MMTPESTPRRKTDRASLHDLDKVVLDADRQQRLKAAMGSAAGNPVWVKRKSAEAKALLALEQVAPADRLAILELDLQDELRAVIHLETPVPCLRKETGKVEIANHVILLIRYPEEALRRALPGSVFSAVHLPRDIYIPQVKQPEQPLCLGASLGPGMRVFEIAVLAYGALSMQLTQFNDQDPAGIFNREAAQYWQIPENAAKLPLTRIPLLG